MGVFIALALALVLATAVAVAWPLRRESRGTGIAIVLAVPAIVAGLYAFKGQPAALDARAPSRGEQIQQAEAELLQRLAREPDNFEAWVLLGRLRAGLQRFQASADAFAQAHALAPEEPNVMVEYAEAQMRANPERRFPPAAASLLEKAIAGNPRNQRALFFLGMHRMQGGDFAGASETWERLLPLVDERTAAALLPQVNQARELAGMPPIAMPEAAKLRVSIDLAAALRGRLPPDAVLFVYARTPGASGPPVAARRVQRPVFPLEIEMSDADSVMPVQALSRQPKVLVGARLSASGSATPASGDLESPLVGASPGSGETAQLLLSEIRP